MELIDIERKVDKLMVDDKNEVDLGIISMDDVVMEEVDMAKENRLKWIKKKQLELWCKELVIELVVKAGMHAMENMCRELVDGGVVDKGLEYLGAQEDPR